MRGMHPSIAVAFLAILLLTTSFVVAQPVAVMSFNVENLFDATDDLENPGENSYRAMPTTGDTRRFSSNAKH